MRLSAFCLKAREGAVEIGECDRRGECIGAAFAKRFVWGKDWIRAAAADTRCFGLGLRGWRRFNGIRIVHPFTERRGTRVKVSNLCRATSARLCTPDSNLCRQPVHVLEFYNFNMKQKPDQPFS
jgi:hypothetical protein